MPNTAIYDELDRAVSKFIQNSSGDRPGDVASYVSTKEDAADICELLEVATQLDYVARPAFKAQLKADLLDEIFVAGDVGSYVSTPQLGRTRQHGNARHALPVTSNRQEQILPSLFGNAGMYSVQRKNFAASALLHATAMGLLIVSSTWMAQRGETPKPRVTSVLTDVGVYVS